MSDDPGGDLAAWYADRRGELLAKPPEEVAHELPGLIDRLRQQAEDTREYVVGVSFSTNGTCLDYLIRRIDVEGDVKVLKQPVSENHRYVHFTSPPDPHVDAGAVRARLLDAIEEERREAAEPASGLADVWEEL